MGQVESNLWFCLEEQTASELFYFNFNCSPMIAWHGSATKLLRL